MKLTANVYVHTPKVHALKRCFDAELSSMQTRRSTVAIHSTKDTMQFSVTATDSTALRATINTITKLLTVFEAVENENDSTRKNTAAAKY